MCNKNIVKQKYSIYYGTYNGRNKFLFFVKLYL